MPADRSAFAADRGGLAAYPVEVAPDGRAVRVTGRPQPAPSREEPRGLEQPQEGTICERYPEDHTEPIDALAHRPPSSPPALAGSDLPADRWVWATLVLGGTSDRVVVCDPDATCPADAPEATVGLGEPGTAIERVPTTYLARRAADGQVRILNPADPYDGGFRHLEAVGQPRLSIPDPGTAVPLALRDGTPVFATHTDAGISTSLLLRLPTRQPDRSRGARATGPCTAQPAGTPPMDWLCTATGRTSRATTSRWNPSARPGSSGSSDTLSPRRHHPRTTAFGRVAAAGGSWPMAPGPADHVAEGPDGHHIGPEAWVWVRMSVLDRDGERYLCSLGSSVPDCGVPDHDHGICHVMPDGNEECHPTQEPVVVTPGVNADDTPQLLLVRGGPDGRSVEVRVPAPGR